MSGATGQDVFRLMGFIQDDLRGVQAKLVEVRSMLASMPLRETPPEFQCRRCRVSLAGQRALDFHVQNVHDGPAVPLTPQEEAS